MTLEKLEHLIKIPVDEAEEFKKMIRSYREKLIPSNRDIVEKIFNKETAIIDVVLSQKAISFAIGTLREKVYEEFLYEESAFNIKILKDICSQLETPLNIMNSIIDNMLVPTESRTELITQVQDICGEYAGRICPYIYALSLSNTNSRRSRAGSTFELIIYKMYEIHKYPFVSQKQIGRASFQEKGLGKMVDSLLPSVEAFEQRRDKVIIGTMKTTLRERWQEVIEEITRTGLPQIYLLTMDGDISSQKAQQMSKHNVILVVPYEIKQKTNLVDMKNIISFEEYFLVEIPEKLKYWC